MFSAYEILLFILILYLLPVYVFLAPALIADLFKSKKIEQRILSITAYTISPIAPPVILLIISVNFFVSLIRPFFALYFPLLAKRIEGIQKKLFELRNQAQAYYNNIKKDISSAKPPHFQQQVLAFSYVSLYITQLMLVGGVTTRLAGDFTTDAPPPKHKKKRKSKGK